MTSGPTARPTARPGGARQARRDDVTGRILAIGRRHLAEHGAAGLSLRGVTRDLGMVSSAVYRYVANRDELLTLLLVDAYTELADAVDAAVEVAAGAPWDARVLAAARALRGWALAEPARYALLYGSPVPGYAAPPERTVEPGTRVARTLLALLVEARATDQATDRATGPTADPVSCPGRAAPAVPLPAALRADLAAVAGELDAHLTPEVLAAGTLLWSALIGSVSMEVFGQYGRDTFAEPALLFEHQIASVLAVLPGPDRPRS